MAKIDKEKIVLGALELVRDGKEVTARSVANKLGVSTQPIYSAFKNMDELKAELYICAQKAYGEKILAYSQKANLPPYKAYGMGLVRFAKEEKGLFRFVYMQSVGDMSAEVNEQRDVEAIEKLAQSYGIDKKKAERIHKMMAVYTYGLAVLANLGADFSDEEISLSLTEEFDALKNNIK